jgi:hypothetical protein
VTYLDEGTTPIYVEYDTVGTPRTIATRYHRGAPDLPRSDSGQWRTERIVLDRARFANGQNGGCDFRLVSERADMHIARIRVTKLTEPYLNIGQATR